MTLSRLILLGVALIAAPLDARAQQRPLPSVPQSLSLRDAIDLAERYNPAFRQTANDRAAAAWGVRNAYAQFLPSVTATGGFGYRGAGRQTFLTAEFVQQSSTIGSNYSLGMSLELSGRTLMQPGLARAQRNATEATITGAGITLESSVTQQYVTVLEAEAQVGLAELQLARNEEFLRLARARFAVGQNTMLDVRQAEVARGRSEVALLQARQLVTVEKLRLFQLMGVAAPDDPSVVSLPDSFPILEPQWQLEGLLAEAGAGNPTLNALRAQEAAARAGERATKSTWLPTLSFAAGWSGFTQQFSDVQPLIDAAQTTAGLDVEQCEFTNQSWLNAGLTPLDCSLLAFTPTQEASIRANNDVFPFDFTAQPFSASVTVSLPIFTQFSRPLRVAEAAAAADDAREAVRARELEVRTGVSQAYYALRTAYESIGIQANNRTAAAEQLRLATERYRVGSGTFFELLDAQLAAQQAEADYISAVYAYHRSIASLEAAVGRPLR